MPKVIKRNLKEGLTVILILAILSSTLFSWNTRAGLIFKETRQWQVAADISEIMNNKATKIL